MKDIAFVFNPVFGAVDFAYGCGEITGLTKVPKDVGQAIGVWAAEAERPPPDGSARAEKENNNKVRVTLI